MRRKRSAAERRARVEQNDAAQAARLDAVKPVLESLGFARWKNTFLWQSPRGWFAVSMEYAREPAWVLSWAHRPDTFVTSTENVGELARRLAETEPDERFEDVSCEGQG